MKKLTTLLLGAGVVLAMVSLARAADLPPEGSKPLSEIVRSVESRGLGTITEIEIEHGAWEVEIHQGTQKTVLHIDAKTGEVQRETKSTKRNATLPPEGSKPLSEIVGTVEKRALGTITEVEFDDGYWEFEIRNGAMKIKLDVNPQTGQDRAP